MIPVRCFTCNKILGRYEETFKKYTGREEEFFQEFGFTRYCCRKILLTHVDIFQTALSHHPSKEGLVRQIRETNVVRMLGTE